MTKRASSLARSDGGPTWQRDRTGMLAPVAGWGFAGATVGSLAGAVSLSWNEWLRSAVDVSILCAELSLVYAVLFGAGGLVAHRILVLVEPRRSADGRAAEFTTEAAGHTLAALGAFAGYWAVSAVTSTSPWLEIPFWKLAVRGAGVGVAATVGLGLSWLAPASLSRPVARRLLAAVIVLVVAIPAVACFALSGGVGSTTTRVTLPEPGGPHRRVLLIGIDGADWRRLDPLIAAGRLPALAGLVQRGVRANLRTQQPTLSPILWTTIATGTTERKHGIHGFTATPVPGVSRPVQGLGSQRQLPPNFGLDVVTWILRHAGLIRELPVTSTYRRVKAVWNIFSDRERRVGVVNWFASWPSEPVNGYLVSDNSPWRAAFQLRRVGATFPVDLAITYPATLLDDLRDLEGPPVGGTAEETLALPFFDRATAEERREMLEDPELLDLFRIIHRGDALTVAAALDIARREPLDLLAVYLPGIDNVSHRFGQRTGVVDHYYEFTDGLISKLLEQADGETVVAIVSDHGWEYEWGRHFGHETAPAGVFLLAGPGVLSGVGLASSPSIVDVTPTLLACVGLPRARDMDGVVIDEALEGPRLASAAGEIDTYGAYVAPSLPGGAGSQILKQGDDDTMNKLRALGYVE